MMGWEGVTNWGQRQNLPLIAFSAAGEIGEDQSFMPQAWLVFRQALMLQDLSSDRNDEAWEKKNFCGLEFWSQEVRSIRSYDLCVLLLEGNVPIYSAPEKP